MNVSLTVNQVLETNGFQNSRVLAGIKGLNRNVTKITIAELSDTLEWLQGGELVCTTAFYLKNNPESQENWIVGMAQQNIAALAIKTERFFGQIPSAMVELAERYNFPLIELPLDVTWPIIIEGFMTKMLDIQTERLKNSLNIYNHLTKVALNSKGIEALIKTISNLSKNPVILEDRFFNLIAYADTNGIDNDCIIQKRISSETRKSLKNNHGLLEIIKTKQKIFHQETLKNDNEDIEQLILPVFAGNVFFGWLTILLVQKQNYLYYKMIMEHGSTVLALELLKEKARLETQSQAKTDFLRILLENNINDEELQNKAKLLGIDLTLPTSVIIIAIKSEITMTVYQKIESYVISRDPQATVMERKNEIVIFYHSKNDINQHDFLDEIKKTINLLCELLKQYQHSYNIGIGRCYSDPRMIKKSYIEAEQALSKAIKDNRAIVSFFELGIDRLLCMSLDRADICSMVEDYLSPLIAYDKKHNSNLVDTLKCYLLNNFNLAETSRQLFLHINSLNYRIQRIETILDIDISNFETCHVLYLTLNFYEHYLISK